MTQSNKVKEDSEPNLVDVHVGKRIRLRRNILHVTQQQLAEMLGLTFQQVQKYEKGMNRVGASRLWDISKVLKTPIGFFYEDMDQDVARTKVNRLRRDIKELGEVNLGSISEYERVSTRYNYLF